MSFEIRGAAPAHASFPSPTPRSSAPHPSGVLYGGNHLGCQHRPQSDCVTQHCLHLDPHVVHAGGGVAGTRAGIKRPPAPKSLALPASSIMGARSMCCLGPGPHAPHNPRRLGGCVRAAAARPGMEARLTWGLAATSAAAAGLAASAASTAPRPAETADTSRSSSVGEGARAAAGTWKWCGARRKGAWGI
jgi:hypothetical protein